MVGEPHALAQSGLSALVEIYSIGGKAQADAFIQHLRAGWVASGNDGHAVLVALFECYESLESVQR
jgi:hypothetical protein